MSQHEVRESHLLCLLGRVPDPRDPRGVRHPLAGVLAAGIAAVVAGARSFTAIGEWAAEATGELLTSLGMTRGAPDEATFRRLFARVGPDTLDRILGAFMWTRTGSVDGRRVIAIDAKTVRGARTAEKAAPHLVAALDHATGTVLGQLEVDAKTNEIPSVRELLACFALAGVVVTVDAMHTQTDTAAVITEAGGDYVFTVKNNTPTLHATIKKLPWADVPAHRATVTGPRSPGTAAASPARSRSSRRPPGPASPVPRRSPNSGAPSPARPRRASRSST